MTWIRNACVTSPLSNYEHVRKIQFDHLTTSPSLHLFPPDIPTVKPDIPGLASLFRLLDKLPHLAVRQRREGHPEQLLAAALLLVRIDVLAFKMHDAVSEGAFLVDDGSLIIHPDLTPLTACRILKVHAVPGRTLSRSPVFQQQSAVIQLPNNIFSYLYILWIIHIPRPDPEIELPIDSLVGHPLLLLRR